MSLSIGDQLAALLAHTQRMLAADPPSLADWEDYGRVRNERFQQLQKTAGLSAASEEDVQTLTRLYASVLENDRLLALKIQHQLSEISRDLMTLSDQRRVFNAYAAVAPYSQSYHRRTA